MRKRCGDGKRRWENKRLSNGEELWLLSQKELQAIKASLQLQSTKTLNISFVFEKSGFKLASKHITAYTNWGLVTFFFPENIRNSIRDVKQKLLIDSHILRDIKHGNYRACIIESLNISDPYVAFSKTYRLSGGIFEAPKKEDVITSQKAILTNINSLDDLRNNNEVHNQLTNELIKKAFADCKEMQKSLGVIKPLDLSSHSTLNATFIVVSESFPCYAKINASTNTLTNTQIINTLFKIIKAYY